MLSDERDYDSQAARGRRGVCVSREVVDGCYGVGGGAAVEED